MKRILYILFTFFCSLSVVSCADDEPDTPTPQTVDQTVIMYFPWSTDLTSLLEKNLQHMERSFAENGSDDARIIVFFASSLQNADMYELVRQNGTCTRKLLKSYSFPNNEYTTVSGLQSIITDAMTFSPSNSYSMIIGCHGLGWVDVATGQARLAKAKKHWQGALQTRYFGGLSQNAQTDISTLRQAIDNCGVKMKYILFDDCYMANVEVAYELRNTADCLIASTSEVMAAGLPYETVGRHLFGTHDYSAVCDGFYNYYISSTSPYGTLSVINCGAVEGLAEVMKKINDKYAIDADALETVQVLDGYNPAIFYDCGDYVRTMCDDPSLIAEFERRLSSVVEYVVCTPKIYSGTSGIFAVHTTSGITISDPSRHRWAASKSRTEWYKATH